MVSEQEMMDRFADSMDVSEHGIMISELVIDYISDSIYHLSYKAKPDLLIATINDWTGTTSAVLLTHTLNKARVSHVLSEMPATRRQISSESMAKKTRRRIYQVNSSFKDLAEVGIIDYDPPMAKLRFPIFTDFMDITAYEGKLHDYKKALLQAIMYQGFANTVRIVMPVPGVFNAQRAIAHQIRILGMGLTGVRDDHTVFQTIKSRKQRPLSRRDQIVTYARIMRRWMKLQPNTLYAARRAHMDGETSRSAAH